MAMIGRNAAVVEIRERRRELHGVVAFGTWLAVHAWLLSGFRERATAVRALAWDYVTRDRAPSIIAPDASRIDWADPPST
jgi:NADH:ubiquinone reductase (H+-translocating)